MQTTWDFTGQKAVIAGAGGIGTVIAEALAHAGAKVAVLDIDKRRLADLNRPAPGTIFGITADLTSAHTCRAALTEAEQRLDGLDILIHAVGANHRTPVLEVTDQSWEQITTINLSSGFWLGQAAGASMLPRGYGRIVYLSSVSGLLAHKDHAPYAATKGGINQLMRVMAREWATSGVTVNAVAPGYTETDLTREYLARPGIRTSMEALVPAGRLGRPQDLIGPILFLASQEAQFVTGHVLYADGGRTLV